MSDTHLLILAHGSARDEWNAPVAALVAGAGADLADKPVSLAWLQHAHPTLAEAVMDAAARGARSVAVLPLFLTVAGHVTRDIPALARAASEAAGIPVRILPAVGETPEFAAMLRHLLARASLPGNP